MNRAALQTLLAEDEAAFDARLEALFPPHVRRMGALHWTPTPAIKKAVKLLDVGEGDTVLDVGAGPGRFCVVASLLSPATFVGVEKSPGLVEVARACALACGTPRVRFEQGDVLERSWEPFTGVYLYNPFEGPMFGNTGEGEPTREESAQRTVHRLAEMRAGTRVVRLNPFGAELPQGFVRAWSGGVGTGTLELWRRVS